jgi:hypothetical protein
MVLTVSSALSLVTGLFCHHRFTENSAKLDASVGASGPHGFAVREAISRLAQRLRLMLSRPSHPASYVRDDRETPLEWEQDGAVYGFDLGKTRSEIFLARGLDR